MKKLFVSFFALAVVCAMAMSVQAAPGDIIRENQNINVKLGPQAPYVIFKDAQNFIAIWTPEAITVDDQTVAEFYDVACNTTPSQAANSEWDAFINGEVVFFSGKSVQYRYNNGGNVASKFWVEEENGIWFARATGVSITVYEEGEWPADDPRYGSECNCKPLFLNIHFQGASDGSVGNPESDLSTKTFSGLNGGGGSTYSENWFGYVRLMNLSQSNPNTFDIVSGRNQTVVGKAVVSLTDTDIVITITGIAAGAKDWKIWIGDENRAATANQGKDGVNGLQVGADMSVSGQYTVVFSRAFKVKQGNKVQWSFDLEDYLVNCNCE